MGAGQGVLISTANFHGKDSRPIPQGVCFGRETAPTRRNRYPTETLTLEGEPFSDAKVPQIRDCWTLGRPAS